MDLKTAFLSSVASFVLITAAGAATPSRVVIETGRVSAGAFAPKFAVIQRLQSNIHEQRSTRVVPPTWIFSYTYGGTRFNETFVGTNPAGGLSTTVPIYIIPLKLVTSSGAVEDPTTTTQNGVSIVQDVLNSPVMSSSVDYVEAGTNIGTTQYLDAFQKMNLWGVGGSGSGYHVLMGQPTVEPVQTLKLTSRQGSVRAPYGQSVIAANINTIDAKINSLITSLRIPSNAFPIFVTVNSYLYQGSYSSGCCIGGYHSVTGGGQPYGMSTYITQTGNFAEDVSALSHEIGEWIDDPNTNNSVPSACGSGAVLENGDPLENNANFGNYTYTVGGVAWHLQDLVTLPYFGAPTSTTLAGRSTFQGESIAFCSAGG